MSTISQPSPRGIDSATATPQQVSISRLAVLLRDDDTLHTQITRVSRSGMRRWMRVYLASGRGQILDLTHSVGTALGRRLHQSDAWEIVLPGCTPDADGHDLIDDLGRALGISLHRARL